MKFVKTYRRVSWNNCYQAYYYIDNKRVSKETFYHRIGLCDVDRLLYNNPELTILKNNRYKIEFHYN